MNKLTIVVASAFSFPWYCLATDQLVYMRASQTTETNIAHETDLTLLLRDTLFFSVLCR